MAAFVSSFCLFPNNTRSVKDVDRFCGLQPSWLRKSHTFGLPQVYPSVVRHCHSLNLFESETNFFSCPTSVACLGEMSENSFNFSRVSDRDELAFGSARPGFPSKEVTVEEVGPWITFMKASGVKRVLSLLGDDEKDFYKFDIDQEMTNAFGEGKYTRTSVFVPGSRDVIISALDAAHKSEEPIVIHCSGGEGRAAIGMSMWLTQVYGISPEQAAEEIQKETDRTPGTVRRISAQKVAHLISTGTMTGFKK